jgi:membrane-associated phospholipid phosphatase
MVKANTRTLVTFCAFLTLAASPLRAQAPDSHPLDDLPSRALLQPSDWLLGALFFGSLASIEAEGFDQLDEVFSPTLERRDAFDRWAPRNLGRIDVGLGLSGATFLIGKAAGSETASRVGLRSLETLLLNTALTSAMKVTIGRARPDSGLDEDDFDAFSVNPKRRSFPSGHTSNVFALATTVSRELRDEAPWVPFVAYPIAAYTGISRVLDQRHWLTDVMAGAALGVFSSRLIERLHPPKSRSVPGSAVPGSAVPESPRLLLSTSDPFVLGVTFSAH